MPRAEAEFRELMEVAEGFRSQGPVPSEQVFANLMPYAPLDLQITGEATHEEISALKNMYFGALCYVLEAEPATLLRAFDCGRRCIGRRRDHLEQHLEAARGIARLLRETPNLDLVASWGAKGAFRVNRIMKAGTEILEGTPSPVMGFFPGGRWRGHPDIETALAGQQISAEVALALVGQLEAAGFTAARRRPAGGVEILHSGIADNLSGLLVLDAGADAPAKGAPHENGSAYLLIERLEGDVYFFETR